MDRLWAPWRAELFNKKQNVADCIFCQFPENPQDHEKHQILYGNAQVFAMMNRYPYNNGHLMIIPRLHGADPSQLPSESYQACYELLQKAVAIVGDVLGCHGINIGMNIGKAAGAGIESHCHFHVVPRWSGDTNFMTVLSEVRVLNEHLMSTYAKLLPAFQSLQAASSG